VSEDLWSERDTTPDAIEAALRDLLRQRHAANPGLAPARVLNLIVVVDRDWRGEVANRLQRVGRYHASRTILCAVEPGRRTLDARAVMSYEPPADAAGVGVMREQVEILIGPDQLAHLDTVIDPVVVPELTTMLWSPHGHDEALTALREMIDVILLDSDDVPEPSAAFERASELLRSAYVVDLAWLRTTPWRERLAASFDPPDRIAALRQIRGVSVRHREGSLASALLLAGWLASRLEWRNGNVAVEAQVVDQESPGLAGITVGCRDGFSLSLDRGTGGLRAR
jgi:glucose-6-phosphate dehydrogenase assembly protein OpcA